MNILGIDIGGSALKGAPVNTRTGRLIAERHRVDTPKKLDPDAMAAAVAQIAAHFQWKGPIGVGFPGVVWSGSHVLTAANLHKGFVDCDAGKLFAAATGCAVSVVNDADAAGLAEITFGAGRGRRGTVLLLTQGTGIGSALFVDGRLYPNSEFGHVPLHGMSAEKYCAASVKTVEGLSWHAWAKRFNEYLQLVEFLTWPELIILGGGISADHAHFFKYLKLRSPLVPAEFFNEAGIVGAALWAAGHKT